MLRLANNKLCNRKINIKHMMIFCSLFILVSCDPNSKNKEELTISFIDFYKLNIQEASGLTYNKIEDVLYSVTDGPHSKIYSINLTGVLIDSFEYIGNDLEAICYDNENSIFWLSEESLLQLVKLDSKGNEIDRIELDFIPYDFKEKRIEGLSVNPFNNNLYLLNEKNPGAIVELDLNSLQLKNIYYLNFALDYSAIDYIENEDVFIILSDENKSAYLWNPKDGLIDTYLLGFNKAEGVAVFQDQLFIVSEQENKLYKYNIN